MKIKNLLSQLLIGIVVVGLAMSVSSCGSGTQTVASTPPAQEVEEDSLTIFEPFLRAKLSVADSMIVYNSSNIKVKKNFLEDENFVKGGILYYTLTDSANRVLQTIPARTSASTYLIERDEKGVLKKIVASFSSNEVTYVISYFRKGTVIKSDKKQVVGKDGKTKIVTIPVQSPNVFVPWGTAVVTYKGKTTKGVPFELIINETEDSYLLVDRREWKGYEE